MRCSMYDDDGRVSGYVWVWVGARVCRCGYDGGCRCGSGRVTGWGCQPGAGVSGSCHVSRRRRMSTAAVSNGGQRGGGYVGSGYGRPAGRRRMHGKTAHNTAHGAITRACKLCVSGAATAAADGGGARRRRNRARMLTAANAGPGVMQMGRYVRCQHVDDDKCMQRTSMRRRCMHARRGASAATAATSGVCYGLTALRRSRRLRRACSNDGGACTDVGRVCGV